MPNVIISPDSFMVNTVDMWKEYSMRVLHYDLLSPPKRERKIEIPEMSGRYNLGAKWHDEREIRMECAIFGDIGNKKIDDMKYLLSKESRIYLWDMPDRYYYGSVYTFPEIEDNYMHCLRSFELTFVCQPYARAVDQVRIVTTDNIIPISDYPGTRETPTILNLTNTGMVDLTNIKITIRRRTSTEG